MSRSETFRPGYPWTAFLPRAALLALALLLSAGSPRAQEAPGASAEPTPAPAEPAEDAVPLPTPSGLTPSVPQPAFDRPYTLPPNAYGQYPGGIPYSSVLTFTGANLNSSNLLGGEPRRPDAFSPENSNSAPGGVAAYSSLQVPLKVPFLVRAPEPEDADLKVGPVFVKFRSIEGLVLADDNFNESEYNRKSELLVLLRLNLTVIAQLSDNLQFAFLGSLEYLPIQNDFGLGTSLNLGLLGPLLAAQFVYDTVIGSWPVRFAEEFGASAAEYSTDTVDNFDLLQEDQIERDDNGRYSFHQLDNNSSNTTSKPLVYYDNTVSVVTDRLLPDDIRLTVRAYHQDLWYNQSNRGLPGSRDDFLTSLVSERQDLRYEPYVTYEAQRDDHLPGITQIAKAGVFGPIDDQVFLRAEVGYFVDGFDHNGLLYLVRLDHAAGPYTSEHLAVGRDLFSFEQEEVTYEYYRLDQILGPTLTASLFLTEEDHQDLLRDGGSDFSDRVGGLQCVWNISPESTLSLAGIYERQDFSRGGRRDLVTGRLILNHNLTDSLFIQLLYQYQHAVGSGGSDSYFENLVYFRLVKLLQ